MQHVGADVERALDAIQRLLAHHGAAAAYVAHLRALSPTTAFAADLLCGQSLELLVYCASELTAHDRCLHKVKVQAHAGQLRASSSDRARAGLVLLISCNTCLAMQLPV
jgi:hypothetical protein